MLEIVLSGGVDGVGGVDLPLRMLSLLLLGDSVAVAASWVNFSSS